MGLFKYLGTLAGRKAHDNKTPEELQEEMRRAVAHEQAKALLSKFEFKDLQDLCEKVLGRHPERYVRHPKTGELVERIMDRYVYENFIMNGNFKLQQIKDFALKYHIVSPSFFGITSDGNEEKREFESIINSIKAQFEPEKITDEDHLQAQLSIFLKAKFLNKKIEREVPTKSGDKLDIVVDDKYVFELKVYRDRIQLRNLGAQLEEYEAEYPNVCAVILDTIRDESSSQNIHEFEDKYKVKYEIPTITLYGKKAGTIDS